MSTDKTPATTAMLDLDAEQGIITAHILNGDGTAEVYSARIDVPKHRQLKKQVITAVNKHLLGGVPHGSVVHYVPSRSRMLETIIGPNYTHRPLRVYAAMNMLQPQTTVTEATAGKSEAEQPTPATTVRPQPVIKAGRCVRRLTELRERQGWTRTYLGAMAGLHPSRVGTIESGRVTPKPDSVELGRLAQALGWTGEPCQLMDEVTA